MSDTDNSVVGYNFFEQDTGVARFVRVQYLPFRVVWDTTPTADDISGINKSSDYMPKITFDLSSPEDMHRGRIIQYVRDTLGRDPSTYLNDLPDDFVNDCLYNVAYDRPIRTTALRLRIGDTLVINPYALAPMYLTMWLLRSMAADLLKQPANSFVRNGELLANLADHLQFAIDRILVKFNLSEPDSGVIIEGYSVSLKDNNGTLTQRSSTLYVSETAFAQWAAKGGDETLLVADWGLNNHVADDTTIANKQLILTDWDAAQNPPAST